MAVLVPDDFPIGSLEHSERVVVGQLVDRLGDDWWVVPRVPVTLRGRDREIDVVLLHAVHGMVVVEVKGGTVTREEGAWFQDGRPLDPGPIAQVTAAKHALAKRLKRLPGHVPFIVHLLAFPAVTEVPQGWLGVDLERSQVLGGDDLAWADERLAALPPAERPLTEEDILRLLRALRPTVAFRTDPGGALRASTVRLNRLSEGIADHLADVGENRRLVVTGPAGCGKTFLATTWVRRALDKEERVLLCCFNEPIAASLADRLGHRRGVLVRHFHGLATDLLEPLGLETPAEADRTWFEDELPKAFAEAVDRIEARFDLVVVDEAQDFAPGWIATLEALLDPAGPRRLIQLGDASQALYPRGWAPDPAAAQLPLRSNLRNTKSIAEALRGLGGGAPFVGAATGPAVSHLPARGRREVRKHLRNAVTEALAAGIPPARMAVLTTHRQLRDDLLADPPDDVALARWEERDEDSVVCETIHRSKGLEFAVVFVVGLDDEPVDRAVLFVGASRATWWLRTVGTDAVRLDRPASPIEPPGYAPQSGPVIVQSPCFR